MFKGKAGSLSYLHTMGLNVPEWRLITHKEIISWGDPILLKQGKIKEFIKGLKAPADTLKEMKGIYAVRSSASVEDSLENSFAGLFSTKLFIKDVEAAVIEVWASLYSDHVLKYCSERKVPLQDLTMDVIVQKMISGDRSGVLFQADPMGHIGRQVIVAGWGQGQGIVDDVTDTDRYIIEGTDIIDSFIMDKKTYVDHDLKEAQVSQEKALISVLNEKDIDRLLAASTRLCTEHFMDIEFTFEGETLYVLQARPITTLLSKKGLVIFDNSNVAENYPNQSSPLTFSALKKGYAKNFKNLISYLDFPEKEGRALEVNLDNLVGQWGGQIYYNLNNWYSVYGLLPFGGQRAVESFNEMVGIKTSSPIKTPKRSFLKEMRLLVRILPKIAGYYFMTRPHHDEYRMEFKRLYKEIKERQIDARNAFELIALLQEFDSRYMELIKVPLFNDFFSSILNHACRKLAISITKDQGEGIYNDLLSHREDLESSRAIYSLLDLSAMVRNNPALLAALKNQEDYTQHKDFHQRLLKHFDRFGDRSQWEMKVEVPTARENPETTLKLIIDYAQSGLSQEEQRNREREKSQEAKKRLSHHALSSPFKGLLFNSLFKKCTEALCFREDSRFDRVRYKGLSRTLLLSLGDELVKKDLLESKEDLFYLTWEELTSLHHDSYGYGYLAELVALRKKHLEKTKGLVLPDRILVNDLSRVERFGLENKEAPKDRVFGIPCSGGLVEAECAVVHDLNDTPSLTGKILIAQRTDPSWGYFFVGVKGIIIEKGSMLSHAAIISRELGIPCIINVKGATSIFQTGTKLSMNGDNGEIKIVTRTASASEPT
jgi:phosphohistidine swiveling domain-containing protein